MVVPSYTNATAARWKSKVHLFGFVMINHELGYLLLGSFSSNVSVKREQQLTRSIGVSHFHLTAAVIKVRWY